MLEAIRKHAQGWLAKAILALIAVTFALFGVDSYMRGDRSGSLVAEVGDAAIQREALAAEIRSHSERMRETMGPAFDPAVTETRDFRKQVLDDMIERLALLQDAQTLGVVTPDSYVASILAQIPAFQEDGRFSAQRYEAVLRQNGRTPAQFENELRQAFMLEVMASPVSLAAFPSRTSVSQISRQAMQQREISWVDLPASTVAAAVKLAPADVEQYYAANKAAFTEPEQVRAEYAELSPADAMAGIEVGDAAVADYYKAHAAEFGQPEQRSASHILIAADKADAAARAKAKARAGELYEILKKTPGRFAELARSESQDPGSAAANGSLGSFARGMMVKPFEDAVFAMKPNEIRGPVETDFGFHVIRLDGIEAARTAPLAQVRAAVVETLKRQQAEKKFAEMAENFGNLVYENADSLAPAAKAVGVTVRQTVWMGKTSAPPPFDNGKLADALFDAESIKSRQNTEAIEIAPGMLVAARVIEHRPARVKPLAEVRQAIEAKLRAEQEAKLLVQKGEETIRKLANGEEPGLAWSAFEVVGRQSGRTLDAAGVKAVFRADAEKLPAYTGYARADGSYRIVRVSRVLNPATPDPALLTSVEAGVMQAQQRADMQAMLTLVKAGLKIKIKDDAIEGR